jgi:Flp pilus assembly protein TadD
MKAKNYTAVISLLEFLDDLDPQNLVDAAAMKAKAYHRSNQTVEAIQVLNSIKDYKETKDSSRLELVRLLVLDKKKKRALPILQKLVTKHQKNNELLKSLIALQIDQSFLKNAENNINKLRLTDKYQDDAEYFRGELLEKKGNFNEALKSYNNVKDGSFLNIAHKKVIYITQKAKGQQALDELFSLKQKNAEKVSDKAYWIKLQADKVFDEKKYKQALVLYNKAIQLTPDNTHYYYYRGLLHERMTNLDLAEKDFNFVLKKRNNDADALNALGYMLSVNTQRLIEAKNYIKKAFEIKPNDPVIMDSLGYILFKMGDLSAAERYLRKAFRLMKNPEVASHLISVLSKSNQHQEAQLIFEEMNEKYPDNHILNNVKQYLHADL